MISSSNSPGDPSIDTSLYAMEQYFINQKNNEQQNVTSKSHQNNTNITIFSIPLIIDKINSHCTTGMLFKLTSVSKYWRMVFLPYLYRRKLVFKEEKILPLPPVTFGFSDWISTHGSYLSNVSTIYPTSIEVVNIICQKCSRLQTLKIPG